MNKPTVVYPYNEILLSNEKEWTTDTSNNMDKCQKHAEQKKSQQKRVYYMIPVKRNSRTGKSNHGGGH